MASKKHLEQLKKGKKQWNDWRNDNPTIKPDFSRANLSGQDFAGWNLKNCIFTNTNLTKTNFSPWLFIKQADLSGATFKHANLEETNMRKVNISNLDFSGATLLQANMKHSIAENTNFSKANISRANFKGGNLKNADLSEVIALNSNFRKSIISGAKFENGDFSEAQFKKSTGNPVFKKVNFAKAELVESDLAGCNPANIPGAIIRQNNFWDNFRCKFSGKRIAVLGEKGVGKTFLQHYLAYGTLPKKYNPTIHATPFPNTLYRLKGVTVSEFNVKDVLDVPGGHTSSEIAWKKSIENADIIIYLFRGDLLMEEAKSIPEDEWKLQLRAQFNLMKRWIPEKRLKDKSIDICLVATHCDLYGKDKGKAEKHKSLTDDEYCKRLLGIDRISSSFQIFGRANVRLFIAQLDNIEGAEKALDNIATMYGYKPELQL